MNAAVVNVVKEFVVRAGTFAKANSPVILAGAAVLGVVGVAVSAVKATQQADDIILAEVCENNGVDITAKEKVKATWKCYIPTAILAAGTIACIAGSTAVGVRRLAAATLAYEAANGKLANAKEEIEKFFGEPGEKVFDTAASEKIKISDMDENLLYSGNEGTYKKVVDSFDRRWVTNDIKLMNAQNLLNDMINKGDQATLNDWYELNGLDPIGWGEMFVWNPEGDLMDLNLEKATVRDGVPYIYLEYDCKYNDYYGYRSRV